jgi:hypothetical protein
VFEFVVRICLASRFAGSTALPTFVGKVYQVVGNGPHCDNRAHAAATTTLDLANAVGSKRPPRVLLHVFGWQCVWLSRPGCGIGVALGSIGTGYGRRLGINSSPFSDHSQWNRLRSGAAVRHALQRPRACIRVATDATNHPPDPNSHDNSGICVVADSEA